MPAAEERYANNDDDDHYDKGGNDSSNAKSNTGTDDITSATRMAQLSTRRHHYNEKSHKPKMEHQQEAPAVNKRRHHHKRQGSLRRQQQQNIHKVEEEVSSSRRRLQQPKAGVAEKQVHKKKGGATANENNILQVDELIKSARKRYGNVNDRGKNAERSGINADGDSSTYITATGAAKAIGRNKNKGRQKKKQPKHEKQNNDDRKKNDDAIHNQQVRQGNDNRTFVKSRDDSDNDDSIPDYNCDDDKATTNDVHQRDDDKRVDNTEGRIGGSITTSPQSSGGESAISSDNVNLLPPPLPSPSRVRTEHELETQRRHAIKVQTFYDYDEDEDCENVECNLDYEEMLPDHLYQYQFSNRLADDDGGDEKRVGGEEAARGAGADSHQGGAINREEDRKEIKIEANDVGKNGWHRMLALLQSSTDNATSLSASSGDKLIESDNKGTNSFDSTLDQRTVMNVLENPHYAPILSEEDALRDEYETLQREIESLGKDRLALESLFNEIETEKMRQLGQGCHISGDEDEESYRKFRQNLKCMKSEDLMSIPSMLWKEDVQLESPPLPHHNRRHRHGKDSKLHRVYKNDSNKFVSKIGAQFQESVREHRGKGLALLIADTECKNALIEHCYTRYYMNKHGEEDDDLSDSIRKPTLRVEGAATMIHGGGEYLRFCGVFGQTSLTGDTQHYKGGTSYFLKFDGGKSYLHGSLPSNLMNRLSREEGKELNSIRYLSAGSMLHGSSSIYSDGGGERCYYLEFDSGECWWNVPSSQGEHDRDLQQIFSEVDVHRVAFGSPTSEIIDASASWIVIAKDGSVFYRNIPQGLHDTLTARDAEESHAAPCEVSLGVSGSYFIRFLDDSVDYNLPIFAADEFEKFESQGLLIRNVSLHVDTADCIMRFQ
eukprot:scaffold41360_cov89-Skeletonema_dohrnii-CCMP3373.AAC.1